MMLTVNDLMGVADWSRAQFALTAIYHWLFVPLTLGLGWICAIMETRWYRTGDPFWLRTAKFWMRIFGINFAIGVATGLILEFEFGTNWSNYSYFVGDIFGAPLAVEGIMAFFLESTFVAVMFFGWNKVSRGFHLASTWLTAIGANLSALWILVANAWMQYPTGTQFNIETMRQEMTSFWDVLFSPMAMSTFFHTVTSAYMLAAVVVIGISAWYLLRRREQQMARKSMVIASVFGLAASLLVAFTGDRSGAVVAKHQPMKLAAMEGLYNGQKGAGLVLFGVLRPQTSQQTTIASDDSVFYWKVEVPKLLSLMSFGDKEAFVPGINNVVLGHYDPLIYPSVLKMAWGRETLQLLKEYQEAKAKGDPVEKSYYESLADPNTDNGKAWRAMGLRYIGYGFLKDQNEVIPPVPILFYSFRVMVGLGVYFIFFFAVTLFLALRQRIMQRRVWLRLSVWSIPLAYIASVSGWIVTEVGRQPWTIYEMLPASASVSNVAVGSVRTTFFIFLVLFTVLLIAELMIMMRQIKIGPTPPEGDGATTRDEVRPTATEPFPSDDSPKMND